MTSTIRYQDRVIDPEWGHGRVVELIHSSPRCIGGAAYVEALVQFDDGIIRPVCVDDLMPENTED